jgi:hypothetical protein
MASQKVSKATKANFTPDRYESIAAGQHDGVGCLTGQRSAQDGRWISSQPRHFP